MKLKLLLFTLLRMGRERKSENNNFPIIMSKSLNTESNFKYIYEVNFHSISTRYFTDIDYNIGETLK